jgi:adenosine/AMP kinase
MVLAYCIFCAAANNTEVVLAETEQGLGTLGVADRFSSKGIEARARSRDVRAFGGRLPINCN